MIRQISVADFKCFSHAQIELGQLNVFAGANGTGKSTIIQALLVLFQSVQSGAIDRGRLQLNGPLIEMGTGRDVLYRRSDVDRIQISLKEEATAWTVSAEIPRLESYPTEYHHTLNAKREPVDAPAGLFGRKLLYLSADRLGPQTWYPMNFDDSLGNEVGRRGEFAPLLYGRSRLDEVDNSSLLLENEDKIIFRDVGSQFVLWMRRLFPGFQAQTDNLERMDAVQLAMGLQKEIGQAELFRPSHIGFGVSVAFPVILAGLLASQGSTFIVENPEAHLHPSAQSLLGEFLARVAAGGAQVFVETHSDHVVNGMRIAFKNEVMSIDAFRFFAFVRNDDYGSHRVIPVPLNSSGDFVARPESFFDQADKDLRMIYGF